MNGTISMGAFQPLSVLESRVTSLLGVPAGLLLATSYVPLHVLVGQG